MFNLCRRTEADIQVIPEELLHMEHFGWLANASKLAG